MYVWTPKKEEEKESKKNNRAPAHANNTVTSHWIETSHTDDYYTSQCLLSLLYAHLTFEQLLIKLTYHVSSLEFSSEHRVIFKKKQIFFQSLKKGIFQVAVLEIT